MQVKVKLGATVTLEGHDRDDHGNHGPIVRAACVALRAEGYTDAQLCHTLGVSASWLGRMLPAPERQAPGHSGLAAAVDDLEAVMREHETATRTRTQPIARLRRDEKGGAA